jgi:hypothetical protein
MYTLYREVETAVSAVDIVSSKQLELHSGIQCGTAQSTVLYLSTLSLNDSIL